MAWKEKEFEERMRPAIDAIYRRTFKNLASIIRTDRESEKDGKMMIMDRELAIDTHLYFVDGTVLTFQEKTLHHYNQKYQHFTFEYENDPNKKEPGEWFKLASQLYFFGYANQEETAYLQYWILNIPKLRLFLKNNIGIEALTSKYLRKNKPPAKATFFAIPFSQLSGDGIILIHTPSRQIQ